ncbi:hypothetical protein ACSR0Z_00545 [Streptomyces viridosporus]
MTRAEPAEGAGGGGVRRTGTADRGRSRRKGHGAPHGLLWTRAQEVTDALLAFPAE